MFSDIDKVQQKTLELLQNATPSSSKNLTNMSINYSDQNSSQNSQQPLTQKMLLR